MCLFEIVQSTKDKTNASFGQWALRRCVEQRSYEIDTNAWANFHCNGRMQIQNVIDPLHENGNGKVE